MYVYVYIQYIHTYQVGPKYFRNLNLPYSAFPLKILDNVSSTESGTRIATSSDRRSTSKGTEVSNLYDYFKQFF